MYSRKTMPPNAGKGRQPVLPLDVSSARPADHQVGEVAVSEGALSPPSGSSSGSGSC